MNDVDLRDTFEQWAAPLRAARPPSVSTLRRRARRRAVRLAAAAGAALAVAGVIAAGTAVGLAHRVPRPAPVITPGSTYLAGPLLPVSATPADAPFFVTVSGSNSQLLVWEEPTRRQTGLVSMPARQAPGGARYATMITAIAAAGDDRTFVLALAAEPPGTAGFTKPEPTWIYELRLTARGQPESLRQLPVRGLDTGVTGTGTSRVNRAVSAIAISAAGTRLAGAGGGDTGGQKRAGASQ